MNYIGKMHFWPRKLLLRGLVMFVRAVAYHFYVIFSLTFMHPRTSMISVPSLLTLKQNSDAGDDDKCHKCVRRHGCFFSLSGLTPE